MLAPDVFHHSGAEVGRRSERPERVDELAGVEDELDLKREQAPGELADSTRARPTVLEAQRLAALVADAPRRLLASTALALRDNHRGAHEVGIVFAFTYSG